MGERRVEKAGSKGFSGLYNDSPGTSRRCARAGRRILEIWRGKVIIIYNRDAHSLYYSIVIRSREKLKIIIVRKKMK